MATTPLKVSAMTAAMEPLDGDETLYIVQGAASRRTTVEAVRMLPSYEVANLPDPAPAGATAWASDADGGPVPVYSDGTDWRRYDDNLVVT